MNSTLTTLNQIWHAYQTGQVTKAVALQRILEASALSENAARLLLDDERDVLQQYHDLQKENPDA